MVVGGGGEGRGSKVKVKGKQDEEKVEWEDEGRREGKKTVGNDRDNGRKIQKNDGKEKGTSDKMNKGNVE